MPFFDSDVQHVNDSLASMNVEHDSGRVLAYQVDAKDTVTSKNRFMSQLSILGKLEVVNGQLQMGATADESIAYQSLEVKSGTTLAELEFRTRDFLQTTLSNVFTDSASLDRFYMALDQTISTITGNRNNDFGDVAVNLQVDLPATVLAAWFQRLSPSALKNATMMMSKALQAKLKALIPAFYFQNLDKLQPSEDAAALLAWSAFPPSTSIDFSNGQINLFNTDEDVFWDFEDINLRRAMVRDRHTVPALASSMATARARLLDAGRTGDAGFFTPDNIGRFQSLAIDSAGDIDLHSLLITEDAMVEGAAKALNDVQSMLADAATAPTEAIARFANFGSQLTETFNKSLSIYGNESLRTLNSMLIAEASRVIDTGSASMTPTAMATMLVLSPGHKFVLTDYLSGDLPPRAEVAVAQTLTNAA